MILLPILFFILYPSFSSFLFVIFFKLLYSPIQRFFFTISTFYFTVIPEFPLSLSVILSFILIIAWSVTFYFIEAEEMPEDISHETIR